MSNSLLDKINNSGSIKSVVLSSSASFFNKDVTPTELPVLNIAFAGDLAGGLVSGLTVFAGKSKSFKTLLALYCMKAYFDKNPEAVALFYDSEFGVPADYVEMMGIDSNRIIHVPVMNIEELKFDMVKRLDAIERGDKVFIMVDSIGNLPSKKEVNDAKNENSAADLTRSKELKSLLRIITPYMTMKDLPCITINHVYSTMEMFSKDVVSGGTGVMYTANQVFIISRSQDKNSKGEIEGWHFTINIDKSRFVREKSKLMFSVKYGEGIEPWSGLLDLALEGGFVESPSKGWYCLPGSENKFRKTETEDMAFWKPIINDSEFQNFIKCKFSLVNPKISVTGNEPEDMDDE